MVRITGTCGPNQRASAACGMPAATDITRGRVSARCGASPSATARICCGLTASTTTSAPLHRARVVGGGLDAVVAHQPLQLILARIGNHHALVGRPRLVRPPISAAAMLPPPMNASLRMLFMPIPFVPARL